MRRALVLLVAALPLPAAAQAFADLAEIDREVAAFTGAGQGAPGGATAAADRRLRLRACAVPLTLRWYGQRRDTVEVACRDPGGWRIFIPVQAAPVEAEAPPLVMRGEAVTVSVTGAGFSVSQPAIALDSGAAGSWIRIRPAEARPGKPGEALRAQVMRPGLVAVPLP